MATKNKAVFVQQSTILKKRELDKKFTTNSS